MFQPGTLDMVHLNIASGIGVGLAHGDIALALKGWWPKLRPGGKLAGTNYMSRMLCEAVSTADEGCVVRASIEAFLKEVTPPGANPPVVYLLSSSDWLVAKPPGDGPGP